MAQMGNSAFFVDRDSRIGKSVMRPGVATLASIVSHSDYHSVRSISSEQKKSNFQEVAGAY